MYGNTPRENERPFMNNLADVIKRMGNPFLDDFPELVTMDSRDCMDDAVAESVIEP